jgi:phosphoribosyl-ATP pyrophosphohydrolase/phosphoribosyl-AMP cyclohydrolase
MIDLDQIDFEKGGGLVTVVSQDHLSGAVLIVAHANRQALERTIETGEMHYWSRTRGLWRKGSTSGNLQEVVALRYDCDGDAILARVRQRGPACHTGSASCFGELSDAGGVLEMLEGVIDQRAAEVESSPPDRLGSDMTGVSAPPSYTARLLRDRNLRLKKIGEEAAELVTACADGDPERACEEAADLIYHTLVALHAAGGTLRDVERVLADRHTVPK